MNNLDFDSDFRLFNSNDDEDLYDDDETPSTTVNQLQQFIYSPLIQIEQRRSCSLPPEQSKKSLSPKDYTDHPLSLTDEEKLLERVREDLLGVDLSSVKGPLKSLCLESQAVKRNTSPQSPTLNHIRQDQDDGMRRTVSPQEAFIDFEEVDSKLPRAGSLFAPLPTPFRLSQLPPLPALPPPPRRLHPFAVDKESNLVETDEESRGDYRESSIEEDPEIDTPPELFNFNNGNGYLGVGAGGMDYDLGIMNGRVYESNTRTVLDGENEPCDLPNFVQTAISYKTKESRTPTPTRSRSRSVTPYLESERSTLTREESPVEEVEIEEEVEPVDLNLEEESAYSEDDYKPEPEPIDSRPSPVRSEDESRIISEISTSTRKRSRSRTPALLSDEDIPSEDDSDDSFASASPPPRKTGAGNVTKRRRKSSNSSSSSSSIKCTFVKPGGIICGTAFRRPYDLARHLQTIHSDKGKPQWTCITCKGSFSRKDALIRHARIRSHASGI